MLAVRAQRAVSIAFADQFTQTCGIVLPAVIVVRSVADQRLRDTQGFPQHLHRTGELQLDFSHT